MMRKLAISNRFASKLSRAKIDDGIIPVEQIVISQQPVGSTISDGSPFYAAVVASHSGGVFYEWQYHNGSAWVAYTFNPSYTAANFTSNPQSITEDGRRWQCRLRHTSADNTEGEMFTEEVVQTVVVASLVSNTDWQSTSGLVDGETATVTALNATLPSKPLNITHSDFRDQTAGNNYTGTLEYGSENLVEAHSPLVLDGDAGEKYLAINRNDNDPSEFQVDLPNLTERCFSVTLRIPDGYTMPGAAATFPGGSPDPGEYSDDSLLKLDWNFGDRDAAVKGDGSHNDIVLGSIVSSGIGFRSNSFTEVSPVSVPQSLISYTSPTHITVWCKADPLDLAGNESADQAMYIVSDKGAALVKGKGKAFRDDRGDMHWERSHIVAWLRQNGVNGLDMSFLRQSEGPQGMYLINHYDPTQATKGVFQPHDTWVGDVWTGKVRLGNLDPATDPIYRVMMDETFTQVGESLAIANEIAPPAEVPYYLGHINTPPDATGMSNSYQRNKRLHLRQTAYTAQAGDVRFSEVSFTARSIYTNTSSVAIYEYEAADTGLTSPTLVAEASGVATGAVDWPDVSGFEYQLITVPIDAPVTPGKHYVWGAVIGPAYCAKQTGNESVLKSAETIDPVVCPDNFDGLTMNNDVELAFRATILRTS